MMGPFSLLNGRMRTRVVQEITPAAFERSMNECFAQLESEGCDVVQVQTHTWQLNDENSGYEAFVFYREPVDG